MERTQEPAAQKPPLEEKLQLHLGDKLKMLFAETARSPMPDRFASLLDQLESVGLKGVQPRNGPKHDGADDSSEACK
ncbi:hypothetical protein CCR94_15795 [Rhodoblastus sphagnicola]|uniref:Anti-sigma factor NepR domain-containing protein n=1 Tax=Rhodoblastus sphagnicola TaxID=333368 RepID=A0A2S6N3R9_9HYPH|nr:NepR family anti-sigma factor [Rhodoblastus sphagnicola]MBB4198924.1 hypothetical protein [Rhodoblastus sphagnicola]PPQ29271.1 hypothetical protein CCR94_15795 [Rhodoblastus sphagnicola]